MLKRALFVVARQYLGTFIVFLLYLKKNREKWALHSKTGMTQHLVSLLYIECYTDIQY